LSIFSDGRCEGALDLDVCIREIVRAVEALLEGAASDMPAWLIVVGHHPIYCSGQQQDENSLASLLIPLFVKHNVAAYISGHYHLSEHLQ